MHLKHSNLNTSKFDLNLVVWLFIKCKLENVYLEKVCGIIKE